tara:strand:+ start:97 stop:486 length:390 start_codon:yes stop_codon:yes gene_type:complete
MFYIKELILRLKFTFFSLTITLFLCYLYKNVLLTLLSFSLINDFFSQPTNAFSNFIYTHPIELFKTNIYSALIISTFLLIPYFFWHLFDFLKSSLLKEESEKLLSVFVKSITFVFLFNIISFFLFLPNI